MISISDKAKKYILELAESYSIDLEWDSEKDSIFQEQVSQKSRTMLIKEYVDIEEFNRLFEQHGVDYNVERNQEIFLFNALHGIGHFVLNLWALNFEDPIARRLSNFDQDKEVDKWAYSELCKIKEDFKNKIK